MDLKTIPSVSVSSTELWKVMVVRLVEFCSFMLWNKFLTERTYFRCGFCHASLKILFLNQQKVANINISQSKVQGTGSYVLLKRFFQTPSDSCMIMNLTNSLLSCKSWPSMKNTVPDKIILIYVVTCCIALHSYFVPNPSAAVLPSEIPHSPLAVAVLKKLSSSLFWPFSTIQFY